MKKIILPAAICFALLTSCSDAVIEKIEITKTINYTTDIKAIITTNCTITCHSPSTQLDAGLNLSNYAALRNATENGNVIARIKNGTMPPITGPMSPESIALIEQWKTDGFLEN
ncbi:hypothetical protein OD91_1958 [Lutibacter sp. Hel_I_33_5]|uniref:c-type cytochrome n=1 Tax=Lutibacter sp. Hel_I_33_5 TaxID=1566289 RepID=UPI0011A397B2|nr:hypothetical protein [Lutibacter sp. Hel_I_33_5]TVZ56662.1 hypothetical protein OD91_1958 [Lutibacter sp. Hel_I_33_5]